MTDETVTTQEEPPDFREDPVDEEPETPPAEGEDP